MFDQIQWADPKTTPGGGFDENGTYINPTVQYNAQQMGFGPEWELYAPDPRNPDLFYAKREIGDGYVEYQKFQNNGGQLQSLGSEVGKSNSAWKDFVQNGLPVMLAATGAGWLANGGLAGLAGSGGSVAGSGLVPGTGGTGLAAGTGGVGLAGSGGIGAGIGSSIPASAGIGGGLGALGTGAAGATAGGGLLGSVSSALGVSPGTLVSGAGSLLNAGLGAYASNKAADAQIGAAREANELAKYMYDTSRADYAPWRETGSWALGQAKNLLQDPSKITQDPGYQFGLQQGINAYDNSGAARGMRLSGGQAKALTRFGQDYAGTKMDQTLNRYNSLSGSGLTATGGTAQAGQNYSNQAGQNITGAGNAAASGYIGGANAIAGGVNNFLRSWQENDVLRRLGLGG